jgi:ubiquinone/menaquinone biosynthesis C-methylase UbiE
LYGKSAAYYDAIYSYKNYEKESAKLYEFIQRYKKSTGNTLLDVACGTGNHIAFLKKLCAVEGLDINPLMLKQAKKKHPEIRFYRADMRTFMLDKRYDAITCLFSAIGHVKTKQAMGQAIARMASHLKPGGVLLLEPWLTPQNWAVGRLSANFVNQSKLKLARLGTSKRRGNRSINDEHHLAVSPKGVEYFVERLEMGLFTEAEYRRAFKRAGLKVKYDSEGLTGRGLYIGLRPA